MDRKEVLLKEVLMCVEPGNCYFCVFQGPFATFKMQYDRTCEWTGLKFSNDGKLILISTNGSFIRLIDAFKGVVMHTFAVS